MSKNLFRYLCLFFAVAIMVTIFTMSSQNAAESTASSDGICAFILSVTYRDYNELSEDEKQEKIDNISIFVRKCAHFTEYAFLGFFIYGFFFTVIEKKIVQLCISFACGVLYSITDEIHQMFVPGRSCQMSDVLIDASGVLVGCIIMLLIAPAVKKHKS